MPSLPYSPIKPLEPKVVCHDGFVMSVQASEFHYCSPRENEGPYFSVEVGFPSQKDDLLVPYAEIWEEGDPVWSNLVYPYVPVEIVLEVIDNHGGCSNLPGILVE